MAFVSADIREIQFADGTIVKFNEGETLEEVVSRLEAMDVSVNVF